jgi:hypothetical protein
VAASRAGALPRGCGTVGEGCGADRGRTLRLISGIYRTWSVLSHPPPPAPWKLNFIRGYPDPSEAEFAFVFRVAIANSVTSCLQNIYTYIHIYIYIYIYLYIYTLAFLRESQATLVLLRRLPPPPLALIIYFIIITSPFHYYLSHFHCRWKEY